MDLNQQLLELKEEYMRIQNDLEKVESTGQSSPRLEEKLIEIGQQIAQVRAQL
ncbi:SE1832 family protein [Macrococcoides caseolyticum]|uniref:SE1832 family protein n=1 Tax=Macrococcoides caseolyticum TaxID=69966 RepID=UPI0018E37C84|nr:SE1832 family protein [Macrococcus caseolyticus]